MKSNLENLRKTHTPRKQTEVEKKIDSLFKEAIGLQNKNIEQAIIKLKEANKLTIDNSVNISLFKLEQLPRLLEKDSKKEEAEEERQKIQNFYLQGKRKRIKEQWDNLFKFKGVIKNIEVKPGVSNVVCPYHKDIWHQVFPVTESTWDNVISTLFKDDKCKCWFSSVIEKRNFDSNSKAFQEKNLKAKSRESSSEVKVNSLNQDVSALAIKEKLAHVKENITAQIQNENEKKDLGATEETTLNQKHIENPETEEEINKVNVNNSIIKKTEENKLVDDLTFTSDSQGENQNNNIATIRSGESFPATKVQLIIDDVAQSANLQTNDINEVVESKMSDETGIKLEEGSKKVNYQYKKNRSIVKPVIVILVVVAIMYIARIIYMNFIG